MTNIHNLNVFAINNCGYNDNGVVVLLVIMVMTTAMVLHATTMTVMISVI